jgi:hypothetical protein
MHPTFVMDHRPRADTDHDVVRLVMGPFQKVHVIRSDNGDLKVFGNFKKSAVTQSLGLEPMIVEFQVKVFSTEDIYKLAGRFLGLFQVTRLDRHIDFAF